MSLERDLAHRTEETRPACPNVAAEHASVIMIGHMEPPLDMTFDGCDRTHFGLVQFHDQDTPGSGISASRVRD